MNQFFPNKRFAPEPEEDFEAIQKEHAAKIRELRKVENQKILDLKKVIGEHESKAAEYSIRIDSITEQIKKASTELDNLKTEQSNAIAAGEDYFAIAQDLRGKSLDIETFTNALAAVKEFHSKEQTVIAGLRDKVYGCLAELKKLDAVELVDRYNIMAIELAGLFKEYDQVRFDISVLTQTEDYNGKNNGYAILGKMIKTNIVKLGVAGYEGLPIDDLPKAYSILPGEATTFPENMMYHFLRRRDSQGPDEYNRLPAKPEI